jgi:hypothetical protein
MRSLHRSLLVGAVVGALGAGCGDKPMGTAGETGGGAETGGGSETGSPDDTTSGGGGTTNGGNSAGGTTTTSASGTTGTDPTGGFIMPPDGGAASECDPQIQDCPEGQKCTAVSIMVDEPWGGNKCVEVMGTGEVGDPCDVQDGKYTGIDNCKTGTICLLTDDEGKGGVCVEFCDAGSNCPDTPSASCVVYNDGSLPICLQACNPLTQDCPEGLGCYNSAGDQFVCFKVSAMPGEGGPGGECGFINQCQAGLFCTAAENLAMCDAASGSCCTPYCAVSGGNEPCNDGEECTAFFEQGMAPPGYEDVGVCVVPA